MKKLIILLAIQWTKLLFWFFWLMVPNLITNNVFSVFLLVWNWKTLEKEVTCERSNCNVFYPIRERKKCHMQHNIDICVIIVTKGKCKYWLTFGFVMLMGKHVHLLMRRCLGMTSKKELVSLTENSPSFTTRFHLPINYQKSKFHQSSIWHGFFKNPHCITREG